jgi:hypothetical protein
VCARETRHGTLFGGASNCHVHRDTLEAENITQTLNAGGVASVRSHHIGREAATVMAASSQHWNGIRRRWNGRDKSCIFRHESFDEMSRFRVLRAAVLSGWETSTTCRYLDGTDTGRTVSVHFVCSFRTNRSQSSNSSADTRRSICRLCDIDFTGLCSPLRS